MTEPPASSFSAPRIFALITLILMIAWVLFVVIASSGMIFAIAVMGTAGHTAAFPLAVAMAALVVLLPHAPYLLAAIAGSIFFVLKKNAAVLLTFGAAILFFIGTGIYSVHQQQKTADDYKMLSACPAGYLALNPASIPEGFVQSPNPTYQKVFCMVSYTKKDPTAENIAAISFAQSKAANCKEMADHTNKTFLDRPNKKITAFNYQGTPGMVIDTSSISPVGIHSYELQWHRDSSCVTIYYTPKHNDQIDPQQIISILENTTVIP